MRYVVTAAVSPMGETAEEKQTDSPEEAIRTWFGWNRKYPECVCVLSETAEAADALVRYAAGHPDFIREQHEAGCCYSLSWLTDCLRRQTESGNFHGKWCMTDPFTMG